MNDLDNNRLRLFSLISVRYTAIHAFLEDSDIVFLEQYLAWLDVNPNPPRVVLELNIFYLIQHSFGFFIPATAASSFTISCCVLGSLLGTCHALPHAFESVATICINRATSNG